MASSDTHRALTFREVIAGLPGCRAVPYESLFRMRNLDDLLGPRGGARACVLLYQLDTVGHFIAVFENPEGIQVFDPLGFGIDDELKLVRPDLVARTHQNFPHLARLLLTTRRPVIYSPYQLQRRHTSTCGMWVHARLRARDLSCDDFARRWIGSPDRDAAVAQIFDGKMLD